jgi:hypothetical protein
MLLGFLHSSLRWVHSRFACGCGPNRRICVIPLGMQSMSPWREHNRVHLTSLHNSNAAHVLRRRFAGSHNMPHASFARSAWCNQSGSGPQRNENFRGRWSSTVYRDGSFGCTSPCSHAVPLRAMTMMKHMVFLAMRKSPSSEIASRVGLIGDIKKSLKSIGDLLRWHGSSLCVGGLQRVRSLRAAIYPAHTLVTQNSIVASSRRRARGGRVSQRRRIAALRSVRVGPSRGLGVR